MIIYDSGLISIMLTLVVLGSKLLSLARWLLILSLRLLSASLWLFEAASAFASIISWALIFCSSACSPKAEAAPPWSENSLVRWWSDDPTTSYPNCNLLLNKSGGGGGGGGMRRNGSLKAAWTWLLGILHWGKLTRVDVDPTTGSTHDPLLTPPIRWWFVFCCCCIIINCDWSWIWKPSMLSVRICIPCDTMFSSFSLLLSSHIIIIILSIPQKFYVCVCI